MLKQSAALTGRYLLGIPIVCGWSLSRVFGGTVTSVNASSAIVRRALLPRLPR